MIDGSSIQMYLRIANFSMIYSFSDPGTILEFLIWSKLGEALAYSPFQRREIFTRLLRSSSSLLLPRPLCIGVYRIWCKHCFGWVWRIRVWYISPFHSGETSRALITYCSLDSAFEFRYPKTPIISDLEAELFYLLSSMRSSWTSLLASIHLGSWNHIMDDLCLWGFAWNSFMESIPDPVQSEVS